MKTDCCWKEEVLKRLEDKNLVSPKAVNNPSFAVDILLKNSELFLDKENSRVDFDGEVVYD